MIDFIASSKGMNNKESSTCLCGILRAISSANKVSRLSACVLALFILMGGWGCFPKKPETPEAESVQIEKPLFAASFRNPYEGLDGERQQAFHQSLEQTLASILGETLYAQLSCVDLKGSDVAAVKRWTLWLSSLEERVTSLAEIEKQPDWIVALDFYHPKQMRNLIEGINRCPEFSLENLANTRSRSFKHLALRNVKTGNDLWELLIPNDQPAQLQIGSSNALQRSINRSAKLSWMPPEAMLDHPIGWVYLDTPEALRAELRTAENILPFDPGTLLSGLESITFSYHFQDGLYKGLLSASFSDRESVHAAFAYAQLLSNFALKPYLRLRLGRQGRHFVSSIRNEHRETTLRIHAQLSPSDLEALHRTFSTDSGGWADLLFYLIPSR